MVIGILAAVFAALAYGTASILQARAAQNTPVDPPVAEPHAAPSPASTVAAMLSLWYLCGLALDGLGFLGNLVAARELPLFLAQPIVSANLVVTAVLAVVVLHARLSRRDWSAIGVVVVSLVVLGFASGDEGHGHDDPWLHWTVLIAGLVLLGLGAIGLHLLDRGVAVLAGLLAGVLFGILAVAVRILDGLDPWDLTALLADPALYTLLVCGVGGFYMFTVALQTGSVAAASASLVAGETVLPGAVGIMVLGDATRAGWGPVAFIAFATAVIGAIVVATAPAVADVEAAG